MTLLLANVPALAPPYATDRSGVVGWLMNGAQCLAHGHELASVVLGELLQLGLTGRREGDENLAPIHLSLLALHIPLRNGTDDQADQAVLAHLQPIRKLRHRGAVATGESLDRQQELVLLRGQALGTCGLLAETEKSANGIAEGRDGFEIIVECRRVRNVFRHSGKLSWVAHNSNGRRTNTTENSTLVSCSAVWLCKVAEMYQESEARKRSPDYLAVNAGRELPPRWRSRYCRRGRAHRTLS